MPYTVNEIISEQEVTGISKEDSLLKALSLMNEHDFSQLPVLDENQRPLGMVTYESILKGLRNFNLRLDELKVRNVMTQPYFFYLEDILSDLLERLKTANAVLIKRRDDTIAGIVTTFDTTEYFRRYAEDLMIVEEIEGGMKDLIRIAFGFDEDESEPELLKEAIVKYTRFKKGKSFEKLSFGDYLSILLAEEIWPLMKNIFDMPTPQAVHNLLDGVRQTRNDLAHFQGEISHTQRDQLRFCADWLGQCQSEYEERREVEQQKTNTVTTPDISTIQEEIAEEPLPSDNRFTPLGIFLQNQPGNVDKLRLTFSEIEKIIGGELPPSAYNYRNWWDNNPESRPQSRSWLDVGWRAGYRNISGKYIMFVRVREREKAYIDFFGPLVNQLRADGKVPVRDASPDGASWIVIVPDAYFTVFVCSFARGKRFRVELYIDTGHQNTTKQIFDGIYAKKEIIESAVGQLSWERLEGKRASRIAAYHPGHITDPEKKLETLRNWTVEMMAKFYSTLYPILQEVTTEVL
jgi:CBS domain-containing protein